MGVFFFVRCSLPLVFFCSSFSEDILLYILLSVYLVRSDKNVLFAWLLSFLSRARCLFLSWSTRPVPSRPLPSPPFPSLSGCLVWFLPSVYPPPYLSSPSPYPTLPCPALPHLTLLFTPDGHRKPVGQPVQRPSPAGAPPLGHHVPDPEEGRVRHPGAPREAAEGDRYLLLQ